jgi:hypothetical protein
MKLCPCAIAVSDRRVACGFFYIAITVSACRETTVEQLIVIHRMNDLSNRIRCS